jgi:uncharacterized protein involved in exopolysaccharide biosynthesis
VFEAMRWHWKMVLVCVVVLTAAGIGLALVRTPTYEAEATLNVQFATQGPTTLSGSLTAAQSSAESYARAFASTALLNKVSKKTGVAPDSVISRVTATAIPDNTVVLIKGRGESAEGAERLANAASDALVGYVQKFAGASRSQAGAETSDLLDRYRDASATYNKFFAEQERLAREAKLNPSSALSRELQAARLKTQVASIKRESLFQAYTEGGQRSYVAPLTILARATSAEDDQLKKLQLLGFIGFVAGLAVGAALATLRANRTSAIG